MKCRSPLTQSMVAHYCLFLLLVSIAFLMVTLRIGSLNINGARDVYKREMLAQYIQDKKLDILLLQETHIDNDDESLWKMWWKGPLFLNNGSNVSAGLAILISPGLSLNVISHKMVCRGRMQILNVKMYEKDFTIVNVYAPNIGRERGTFFLSLKQELAQCHQDTFFVLGGDWNCTLAAAVDRSGEEPHLPSAKLLQSIVTDFNLIDCWRIKHPTLNQFTWVKMMTEGRTSAARLDRFYIPNSHCNRVVRAHVVPVSFSDHCAVTVHLAFSACHRRAAYWKFNVKLLQDVTFCSSFREFWVRWSDRKADFDSLKQWWDVGKVQISLFCKQYTAYATSEKQRVLITLERNIVQLQQQIVGQNQQGLQAEIEELRRDMGAFLLERAKGALVRARFQMFREMDAPSSFFFSLERKYSESKHMHALYMADGRLSSDVNEIRERAVEFYSDLYKAENCSEECINVLMTDMPKLAEGDMNSLELPLTLTELKAAAFQMAPGRSPGIDGLPVEFYRAFWDLIGQDLLSVLMECLLSGELPLSCRRAVLTLLPKKGDLCELKNWRPLALLCTDYKFFSKTLANRLKCVLDTIIHRDQSYCIPGRSITDNLFLIRDVIGLSNSASLDIGLVSLDQEKAFDRVNHDYLFTTLLNFGFGESFVKCVKLLYTGASCLVKVGGGLSRPVDLGKGVRQGCGMSGQLFSLAIEPLLRLIRKKVNGLSIYGLPCTVVSAYADDVSIFVHDKADVIGLEECLSTYSAASSAKVNWSKSGPLTCGPGMNADPPPLPGGLQWNKSGLKILGIHLGSSEAVQKNWEGVLPSVTQRLSRWKWLLPQMSYRGRVLIINNLIASTLWHRLAVLNAPAGLLAEIQRRLVDFFWSGQHWLKAAVLFLPTHEGGQGLVDLESRVTAFRLKAAQRLLYIPGLSWREIAYKLLQKAGNMGLDRHLFLMDLDGVNLSGLESFYSSVLKAWCMLRFTREGGLQPTLWAWEEPIFYNRMIPLRSASSSTLIRRFLNAGICKLGHLRELSGTAWKSAQLLAQQTGVTTVRLLERILGEVQQALPQQVRVYLELPRRDSAVDFPSLCVTAAH
uniref:Reverse transcriptase domain-containing protein n=1 Tax=Astyanax mexicanus TaxID=7994 RepID=A0A3B1KAN1_ASTMX